MAASTLLSLPQELVRSLLLHLDAPTLRAIAATCRRLAAAARDDTLWRELAARRFRVAARVARSKSLLAAGGCSWRTLYHQWDVHLRMPQSRLSGVAFPAFARGEISNGAVAWVTVSSADDCRLVRGVIRLRLVVQNICAGRAAMRVDPRLFRAVLTDGHVVRMSQGCAGAGAGACACESHVVRKPGRWLCRGTADDRELPFRRMERSPPPKEQYSARVAGTIVSRIGHYPAPCVEERPPKDEPLVLQKDDFAIYSLDVDLPGALFEVDALERIGAVVVPVRWGDKPVTLLKAPFKESTIWQNYDRLPGGWWVRSDFMSASLQ